MNYIIIDLIVQWGLIGIGPTHQWHYDWIRIGIPEKLEAANPWIQV